MTFKEWLFSEKKEVLDKSIYMYGTRHLLVIALVLVVSALIVFLLYKKTYKQKYQIYYAFWAFFLIWEILMRVINIIKAPSYDFETLFKIIVPMHFCSVTVWVFIIAIPLKNKMILRIATIFGLLATTAFLAYPAVGFNMKYLTLDPLYSISTHAVGFIFSLTSLCLLEHEFKYRQIGQSLLAFGLAIAYGVFLNDVLFVGSNYMYTNASPIDGIELTTYRFVAIIILLFYCNLFYLGTLLKQKIKVWQSKIA